MLTFWVIGRFMWGRYLCAFQRHIRERRSFPRDGRRELVSFHNERDPRTLGTGRYLEGDFLIGYGLWVTGFNVTGLVGPAFAQIDDLGAITDRWGVKASIEINARSTDWMIASGWSTLSTVTNNLQVQAKAGFKISEGAAT